MQSHIFWDSMGVSNERVRYGHKFCGTWARKWLLWQGPEVIVLANYIPVLSSERAPHTKKPVIVRKQKSGHGLEMGSWHQDNGRLTVGRNLTSVSYIVRLKSTNVSEEHVSSIFRVKEWTSRNQVASNASFKLQFTFNTLQRSYILKYINYWNSPWIETPV
jgi:hypothetical protein